MTTDVTIREQNTALELPDESTLIHQLQEINRFQKLVHANLVNNLDYGIIPGTTKPTLLKPGAEKIAKLLGLADHYEVLDQIEDWTKPFFHYKIRCSLINMRNNVVVSTGMGECNSYESKYRWRDSKRKCPACKAEAIIKGKEEYGGGWLCFKKQGGCGATFKDDDVTITGQTIGRAENPDIYDQVNTIFKMTKKRALVDAALSAGRLSDVFTQDMEDLHHDELVKVEPKKSEEKPKTIKKESSKAPPLTDADFNDGNVKSPRDPASIKTLGNLYTAVTTDWPEKFAVKSDVLKFLNKTDSDIVDPASEYIVISTLMKGQVKQPS